MADKQSSVSTKDNPLVRALARWEWEGGSVDADWEQRAALIQEEEHILHCLGAAVIMQWNNLPMEVQRELFASAASLSDPLPTAELKEHIAHFLHSHKRGARRQSGLRRELFQVAGSSSPGGDALGGDLGDLDAGRRKSARVDPADALKIRRPELG